MVIIEDELEITRQDIAEAHDAEHLERLIESRMHESLCSKMKESLKDMSLLDIEPRDSGDFIVKAAVVLDTQQNILTALQMLSTKLYDDYDFTENQVEEVLAVFTQNTEGF